MNVGVAHNRMPPSTFATEMASSERVLGCPTLKSKWVPMFGPMVVSASLTSKRNISSFSHSRLQSRSSWRCRCRHSRLQSRSSWRCRYRPLEVLKSSFCQIPSTDFHCEISLPHSPWLLTRCTNPWSVSLLSPALVMWRRSGQQ
ncbi:hypothetical protein VPH35_092566 [Triticum aestivum]